MNTRFNHGATTLSLSVRRKLILAPLMLFWVGLSAAPGGQDQQNPQNANKQKESAPTKSSSATTQSATTQGATTQGATNGGSRLVIAEAIHIVGLAKVGRNRRVELILTDGELIVQREKEPLLRASYQQLRRVQLLSGERDRLVESVIAASATYGVGGLLMKKKKKVDTLLFDYVNENGGLTGLILQ